MKAAIRLDDITPDMDFTKFNRMKQILDTYQIKPLIGVVPFNEDSNLKREEAHTDFKEFLNGLAEEGYTIALHGWHHVYTTTKSGLFPLNNFSEFAGISFEEQLLRIKQGKERLKEWGIETDLFMAPAHTFDKNTLKALRECGFKAVTDGFGKSPYLRCGLTFYPIAVRRTDCFSDKEGFTTLVIHANSIEDKEFEQYEAMIREHQECFISYSQYRKVQPEKRTILGNIWEYVIAGMKHMLVTWRTS